ncbi:sideroflexin-1-3 [Drosophila hydei]|uniref:Sidoreflexin n=1 Tax=Drosophila hydei TaxID=7224 RepID=A0A6J1LFH9_DROHY|nr:sideroflexin-1-3 [Drosophila hydei]XP_023164951.1 sideroflexin-1-3 [Drosophila hydei]XP_023164960.1 sideroflexin-1-3 [Drosophila hydei]
MSGLPRVDIDKPKFDQSTYIGRAKHFFLVTNPLNLFATDEQLQRAREIVTKYRSNQPLPSGITLDEVWKAKYLYDSAHHPETGEKQIIVGRMSAQMPMNTFITAGMMTFYKTTRAVIFWQWFNQTFNAIVNYTNRSGTSPISQSQLLTSYCLATGGALATALSLNRATKNMSPIFGRLVPLVAVAAANCINIPCMRMQELRNGVVLLDEKNKEVGISKKAAMVGISAVVISRISMAIPGMTMTPLLMNKLEKNGFLKKYPRSNAPIQTVFCGFILIFATPLGCAFFSQRAAIKVDRLESEVRDRIKKERPDLDTVWYNKGL